ncbi:hypothetical protein HKD37_01G001401 [Glycine soja]
MKANLCLMADTTSDEFESNKEDEVNFNDPKILRKPYHELLSNSSILLKDYKKLQKEISLDVSTQTCGACMTLKEKKFELCIKIKTNAIKHYKEIRTFKTTLAKFVNGMDNLNKLLGYCRNSSEKFGNGYDGKVYVHDKDTIICYFYGKIGHTTSKCKDRLKRV